MPFADALVKVGELGAVEFIDGLDLIVEDDAVDPPVADETSTTS